MNLNSTRFLNLDCLLSLSTRSAKFLDILDNIHSLDNFSENNMFPIKPACHNLHPVNDSLKKAEYSSDKELGSIGVWAGICHGEKTWFGVLEFEVFVSEFFTVDGFSAGAALQLAQIKKGCILVTSEISSLKHEIRNDTVESTACVSLSLDNFINHRNTYPFCPVHNSRKFLAVLGTASSYNLLKKKPH
jgi:hypothetical protein